MKNFFEYVSERGIKIPEGNISGEWFRKYDFPMIVRCTYCGMNMSLPSARIDDEGYVYCVDYAKED